MAPDDLGPLPEATTQEPDLRPGGVDGEALHDDPADDGLARDLDPDSNPAVDDVVPEEVTEPDDKSQAPDDGEAADATTPGDPKGSVEPPA